uniref:Uncharacterized protein n=1 Tax=Arundo donax TaxID=35708 RepID=A0A0A8ZUY9_ARUDO
MLRARRTKGDSEVSVVEE